MNDGPFADRQSRFALAIWAAMVVGLLIYAAS
jgi:hypothetical protein